MENRSKEGGGITKPIKIKRGMYFKESPRNEVKNENKVFRGTA